MIDEDLWLHIWDGLDPKGVKFFLWTVAIHSINTMGVVQRRLTTLCCSHNTWVMRCKSGDSINHLLLHCEFFAQVWNCFRKVFGLHGCMLGSKCCGWRKLIWVGLWRRSVQFSRRILLESFCVSFGNNETRGSSLTSPLGFIFLWSGAVYHL